jgi:V/A-type H+-transporting ATPase subunit C
MLSASPVFVQKTDYAYAVARVRALETKLIDAAGLGALLSAPVERFPSALAEVTGFRGAADADLGVMLSSLEDSYSHTFATVRGLILEGPVRRLLSLRYDYEMLKAIVREARGYPSPVPREIEFRSNYTCPELKGLLEEGRVTVAGETLTGVYVSLTKAREATGKSIDDACDRAYYAEVFSILNVVKNDFLSGYFARDVDARNILTALRLKAHGEKRSALRERCIPFGSIDISYLEIGLDMNLDGFASRIVFSPFSEAVKRASKAPDGRDQVVILERELDEEILRYLKQSIFVTFGIEPLITYLLVRENEVRNLRLMLLAKASGMGAEEIKAHLRGLNG